FRRVLFRSGQPGLAELRQLLEEIFSEPAALGQVLEQRKLPSRRPRVYRLRFVFDGWVRSVVAKRMELDNAQRNQLAIRRWLPARSEEHTSELQSPDHLVCRLLLEEKNVHVDMSLTEAEESR